MKVSNLEEESDQDTADNNVMVFSGCLVFLIITLLWLTLGNLVVRGFWGRFRVFQVLMLATLFCKDICMKLTLFLLSLLVEKIFLPLNEKFDYISDNHILYTVCDYYYCYQILHLKEGIFM